MIPNEYPAIVLPAWIDEAVCASVDAELWFPGKGDTTKPAKALCATCPVSAQCLAWAMETEEQTAGGRFGIYGGLSPRERARLARRSAA